MISRIVRPCALVFLVGFVLSCSTDPDISDGLGDRVRVVVPAPSDRIGLPGQGLPQQSLAIRDSVLWRLRWEEDGRSIKPRIPPHPVFDFETVMIALVSIGGQGGFRGLSIDSMTVYGTGAVVDATAWLPGRGCIYPAVAVSPTAAVRFPRTNGDIRFRVGKREHVCK